MERKWGSGAKGEAVEATWALGLVGASRAMTKMLIGSEGRRQLGAGSKLCWSAPGAECRQEA